MGMQSRYLWVPVPMPVFAKNHTEIDDLVPIHGGSHSLVENKITDVKSIKVG